MKVEPTNIHLASDIFLIQGFVSDRLHRMLKAKYFYRIHNGCMYVCILICTLVSDGMDGCMYVDMYIGILWYGRLYVC
jgi:hypothetical protein